MALIAINPDSTFEYSLKDDASENKTIFQLGTIDSFVRAYIDDNHLTKKVDGGYDDVAIHSKYLEFVRYGLKGWKNFKDAEGKDVEFRTEEFSVPNVGKRTIVSEESIKKLELSWIIELGYQIVAHNKLSQAESKN